ncbi:MAG: hypothetical protein KJZ80_11495 [Hyphomicrobiaceae bacterium]|nr:hypothetical protein [Hyphomicrobiaceae bacterium]
MQHARSARLLDLIPFPTPSSSRVTAIPSMADSLVPSQRDAEPNRI